MNRNEDITNVPFSCLMVKLLKQTKSLFLLQVLFLQEDV